MSELNTQSIKDIMAAVRTMKEVEEASFIEEANIIEEGKHTPVSKTKIQVIYSSDSIFSTVTASMMKRLLQERLDANYAARYEVKFTEIASLYVGTVDDVYIWLGMEPINKAVNPKILSKFLAAKHATINERFKGEVEISSFEETVLQRSLEDGRSIRYMTSQSEPLSEAKLTASHIFGFVSTGIARLSSCIPEIDFNDLDNSMMAISRMENCLMSFYTKQATVDVIVGAWRLMNESLQSLGHTHNYRAINGSHEERLDAYLEHYRMIRAEVNKQSNLYHEFFDDNNKKSRVAVTHFANDFWLVRRVITMSNPWYHNARLTHFGLHVESNVGNKARAFIESGRTVNEY